MRGELSHAARVFMSFDRNLKSLENSLRCWLTIDSADNRRKLDLCLSMYFSDTEIHWKIWIWWRQRNNDRLVSTFAAGFAVTLVIALLTSIQELWLLSMVLCRPASVLGFATRPFTVLGFVKAWRHLPRDTLTIVAILNLMVPLLVGAIYQNMILRNSGQQRLWSNVRLEACLILANSGFNLGYSCMVTSKLWWRIYSNCQ